MRELIDHLGYVPRSCVWEVTTRCNLACAHCGTNAVGKPRQDELDTEACLDVVEQLAVLGNRHITLSGGEPTLRKDWVQIARAAADRKITVNMVTNGQSDPRLLAKGAAEARLVSVAVSLDGLEPTHDLIRARGAFARTAETIRVLSDHGFWVDVMMTLNQINIGEIEDVARLAASLGARGFRVQLGKPMGKQTHRDDLTLRPAHLLVVLPLLGKLATSSGLVVRIGDSIGYYSEAERALRGARCGQGCWTGCYAGCQAIGIQADGGIKGCLSLQPRAGEEDVFVEGNVRQHSLPYLWNRKGAFAYNRSFTLDQLDGMCAQCSHARLCRGGAKCVAHAYTGGLGHDPMCYLAAVQTSNPERRARVWPQSGARMAEALLASIASATSKGDKPALHPAVEP